MFNIDLCAFFFLFAGGCLCVCVFFGGGGIAWISLAMGIEKY
jgi:hypothetical protein